MRATQGMPQSFDVIMRATQGMPQVFHF